MTKLADVIRRATSVQNAPIGFGHGAQKVPTGVLLIALLDERWSQRVGEASAADAYLLTGRPNDNDLAQAVAAAAGKPCGLLAPQPDADQLERARKAGLDFLVVDPDAAARVLQEEGLAFVLHLRADLNDMQLRAIDALPVDALYLDRDASPLTVLRELELVRAGALARKPLIVPPGRDAQQNDLLSLRDAGVVLLALDVRAHGVAELARLRSVIDALPRRRRPRREDGAQPLVPRVAAEGTELEEEDED